VTDNDQPETEPRFEEALSQLDRIVESLERGEPELSSALGKYEKGVKLLAQCYRLLDQAELSVALLTGVDAGGNPVKAPFDATATLAKEAIPKAPSEPDMPPTPPASRASDRPSARKSKASPPPDTNNAIDPPF
jgi:exodeoxyribonuclease VII small subunit